MEKNMDNKIQELTEKIYYEGVEKGNEEAKRIIENAHTQEDVIINEAKTKAAHILNEAGKRSQELKKNTEAELKLSGRQTIDALKTEITNLITGSICNSSVKAVFADKEFIQKLILSLVSNYAKKGTYTLLVENAEEVRKYLESNTKGILDKKIKIEQVNEIRTSFCLMPADGSYKISFGEEEFINYFKEFLRPQVMKLLFEQDAYE